MKLHTLKAVFFSAALAVSGLVFGEGQVEGSIEAFIVSKDDKGNEIIERATEAAPGDVMEYRLIFTNNTDAPVQGLKVTDPVPVHTSFLAESARAEVAANFLVSIDGGATFEKTPVTRIETQADGTQKKVVIPPEQYTHLRWDVKDVLDSDGEPHVYAYRVVVN